MVAVVIAMPAMAIARPPSISVADEPPPSTGPPSVCTSLGTSGVFEGCTTGVVLVDGGGVVSVGGGVVSVGGGVVSVGGGVVSVGGGVVSVGGGVVSVGGGVVSVGGGVVWVTAGLEGAGVEARDEVDVALADG